MDHHRRHGGLEPHPAALRQRHPCGLRLQAHLGGRPRHPSQHYAGVSFDVGQGQGSAARNAIWNAAKATGAWGYVEPQSMTPTWVHFDRRYGKPACSGTTAGYPPCTAAA